MTTVPNRSSQTKKTKGHVFKAHSRSPYREHTHVVRVPDSLMPKLRKLLAECRQGVLDAAYRTRP